MADCAAPAAVGDLVPASTAPSWASTRAHAALVQVLRVLPLDVRAHAACVCRAWRDVASDPALHLILCFAANGGFSRSLSDATLARLCARAGAALQDLRLDAPACAAVTAAGVVAALQAGGCSGLLRLTLPKAHWTLDENHRLMSAEAAQQLAVACPVLEHAACSVRCARAEDVADVCTLLPGPLTLFVEGGPDAARAALQLPASVAALVMESCRLDAHCLATLGQALRGNSTLTTLMLRASGVGDAGCAALGDGLRANGTLTTLGLHYNGVSDAGAAALGGALRTHAALTSLDLSSNRIGDAGAAALAQALRSNTKLAILDLSANAVGDMGAAALGDSLRTNSALARLSLLSNEIGNPGAIALGESLQSNSSLRMLNLEKNFIGQAGVALLRKALRGNAGLLAPVMLQRREQER